VVFLFASRAFELPVAQDSLEKISESAAQNFFPEIFFGGFLLDGREFEIGENFSHPSICGEKLTGVSEDGDECGDPKGEVKIIFGDFDFLKVE